MMMVALFSATCFAQTKDGLKDVRYTAGDVEVFEKVKAAVWDYRFSEPSNELIIRIAKTFLGTPYVAETLEKEPEMLTVNMRETDCILFVEMCLCLTMTLKSDTPDFETYVANLRKMRYIDGVVDGYASRNHYTSGWIIQGEQNGVFEEITSQIGGKPYDQKFSFMSTHPDSYRQLKDNPGLIKKIMATEKELEAHDYYLISKEDIPTAAPLIQSGDILCYNTSTKGLDIAHVVFAYKEADGVLRFIHASGSAMKVQIDPKHVKQYTDGIKSHNGIRIVRLK